MRQKRFTLSNILLYFIIAISMIAIQRLNLGGDREMSILEVGIILGNIIILSLFYFIREHKNHTIKTRPIIIIILLALFAVNIYTTFSLPNTYAITMADGKDTVFDFTAAITNDIKIVSVMSTAIFLYVIYLFLVVLPQKIYSLKQLKIVFYVIMIIVFVAMIYSFVSDAEGYKELFSGKPSGRSEIVSFTGNPNCYAALLFFGIASCIYMHHLTKNVVFYIVSIIFAFAITFTMSRTYALSAYALIVGYLLFRAIYEFKNHKIKVIVSSSVIICVTVAIAVPYGICYVNGTTDVFPPFIVMKLFFDRLGAGLSGREILWKQTISILNSTSTWAFGMGFSMFDSIFYRLQLSRYAIGAVSSPHNGVLQIVADGGIVLLALIVLLIVFLFYASARIYKQYKRLFWLNLIMFLVLLFQMAFEAPAPFAPGHTIYSYCFMTGFMFLPVLSTYYQEKHGDVKRIEEPVFVKSKVEVKASIISQGFAFIFTLAYILLAGIFLPRYKDNNGVFISFVVFAHLFILVPFLIELCRFKKFSFIHWFKDVFLPYAAVTVVLVSICHGVLYFVKVSDQVIVDMIVIVSSVYFAVFLLIPQLIERTGFIGKFVSLLNRCAYYLVFLRKKNGKNVPIVHTDQYYDKLINDLGIFKKNKTT